MSEVQHFEDEVCLRVKKWRWLGHVQNTITDTPRFGQFDAAPPNFLHCWRLFALLTLRGRREQVDLPRLH